MANYSSKPKAKWKTELLILLEEYPADLIPLTQLEKAVETDRHNLSRSLSRIVDSKKESVYKTGDLYKALQEQLKEGNT